jgi:hypothetical protein
LRLVGESASLYLKTKPSVGGLHADGLGGGLRGLRGSSPLLLGRDAGRQAEHDVVPIDLFDQQQQTGSALPSATRQKVSLQ